MADVQSNIEVNLDASQALGQLKALQRQLSTFHSSIATSSSAAAKAQADLQSNLINSVNATGKFAAGLTTIKSSADSFTDSLEKNKFSTREYFRYAGGATKTFGRLFKSEYDTIGKVSEERLKTMQTQYIKMGRAANGAIQAISIRPLALDMDHLATKTALAAQKQQLFGQLLKQGSTNLLNFGKNTQWAGRQLMVGFTVPLAMLGTTAGKTFMELEKQAIRFKRVYGEMFTTSGETEKALKDVQLLAKEFLKYGVAVEKTMEMAADAAASGKMGAELMAQVAEATRLAVLGGVEQEKALETTISLTNAFGIAADQLKNKIDFLNAVENQTVLNIEDLTVAIPKAGPVIRQLGGDVEDLAFFMTAMKEGGINASEGANALKSGLASLINPSKKAAAFLKDLGVDINGIVEGNQGNIKDTVIQFAQALDTLAPLERSRAIEQLFGKFQFSRLSTLFQNITKDGTQASRTLTLAGASVEELAILSERELAKVENATGTKFKKSLEGLKLALAPVGEQFLKALTPIVEFFGKILEKFNGLGDGSKKAITMIIGAVGLVGPALLMTFGLIANGAANIIKLFLTLRNGFLGLGKQSNFLGNQTQYLSSEQIEANAIASSLDQTHSRLIQTFTSEVSAANALAAAYQKANIAGANFARINPGMMQSKVGPKKYANGVVGVPGPKGAGDIIPAMLSPGESIIPAAMTQKYAPLIQGMVADNIPGYVRGVVNLGMPRTFAKTQSARLQEARLEENFARSSFAGKPPTDFGHLMKPFTGHSFPIKGVGGVYRKPDGSVVVVKPVTDELSGIAEINSNTISRDDFDLVTPQQKLSSMIDPTDPRGQRKILVLESPYNPAFATLPATFTRDQYIKQLVASSLRGDKDLSPSNLGGNIQVDAGASGIYSSASGFRELATTMPSMAEQAAINVLGVKGSYARRFFAEATQPIAASLSPQEFESLVLNEIRSAIPKLKKTISSFKLAGQDVLPYEAMLARLEAGQSADWQSILEMHKKVVPGFSNGIVSVPGPKGAGDVVPAMLSPGESVISTAMTKKYGGLINSIIADNVPGYKASKKPRATPYTEEDYIPADKINAVYGDYAGRMQFSGENFGQGSSATDFASVMAPLAVRIGESRETKPGQLTSAEGITNNNTLGPIRKDYEPLVNNIVSAVNQEFANLENIIADSSERFATAWKNAGQQVSAQIDEFAKNDIEKGIIRKQMGLDEDQYGTMTTDTQSGSRARRYPAGVGGRSYTSFTGKDGAYEAAYYAFGGAPPPLKANGRPQELNYGHVFDQPYRAKNNMPVGYTIAQLEAFGQEEDPSKRTTPTNRGSLNTLKGNINTKNEDVRRDILLTEAAAASAANLKRQKEMENAAATAQAAETEQIKKNTAKDRVLEKETTDGIVAQDQVNKATTDLKTALQGLTTRVGVMPRDWGPAKAETQRLQALGLIHPATPVKTPPEWATKSSGPLPKINMQGAKLLSDGIEMVPGSGNKDTVPAMLTPGEAVIPADMAKKYAPLIRGIISGKIPGYATGIDEVKRTDNRASGSSGHFSGRKITYGKSPDPIISEFPNQKDAQTVEAQRVQNQKLMQRSSAIMMTTMMATSALGMFGNDMAQKLAPITQGLSAAMMGMQMIRGPWSGLAVGVSALALTFYLLNKKAKDQAIATSKMVDAQNATTEKMKELGKITNKVGSSELYSRKREKNSSNTFTTGFERAGQQFGTSVLESDVGKNILESFKKSLKTDGQVAVKQLGTQLATYVSDGLMSPEQARSFARAIGINMSDMTITSQINGQLREIIGPDGQDLLKDPLTVRLKIVEANKTSLEDTTKLLEEYSKGLSSFDSDNKRTFDFVASWFTELPMEKVASQAASMGAQALEATQSQIDAQNQMYDKQINVLQKQKETTKDKKKQQEIDSQINSLLEKRKNDEQAIRGQAKEILKMQLEAYNTIVKSKDASATGARQAFFEGLKNQVKTKAKEQGQEVFGDVLLSKTKNLKSKELEVQINTIVGSGMLTSLSATKMIDIFAGKEDVLEKTFSALLTTQDPGKVGELFNILSSLKGKGSKETAFKIATEISAKGQEKNFDKRLDTLNNLQLMDGKEINMAAYLKVNGIKKLDKLAKLMGFVEEIPSPLTKEAVLQLESNVGMPEMDALIANWDFYAKLPDELRKTAVQTFIAINETVGPKEIADFQKEQLAKAGPMSPKARENFLKNKPTQGEVAQSLNKELYPEGGYKPTPKKKTTGGGGDGRDTTFDDMAKKLKLVQQASIDALGGMNALRKAMNDPIKKGGGFNAFNGIANQLLKSKKVGTEFVDYIKGLSPEEIQKKFNKFGLSIKNGILKIGKDAATLNKVLSAIFTGDLVADNAAKMQELSDKTKAVNILRQKGVSYEVAMAIAANNSTNKLIVSGELRGKQLDDIIKSQSDVNKSQVKFDRVTAIAQQDALVRQSMKNEALRAYAEFQEKVVENEFILQRTTITDKLADNAYALDLISRQEDKINEKYDTQIKSLEEINALAEKNNALTSTRMSIADALAKGDIAAASSAMQEYRNAKIQQVAKTRMEALQKAKENAIKGVRSPGGQSRKELEDSSKTLDEQSRDIDEKIRLRFIKIDENLAKIAGYTKAQIKGISEADKLAMAAGFDADDKVIAELILKSAEGVSTATTSAMTIVDKAMVTFNKDLTKAVQDAGQNFMDPAYLKAQTDALIANAAAMDTWASAFGRYLAGVGKDPGARPSAIGTTLPTKTTNTPNGTTGGTTGGPTGGVTGSTGSGKSSVRVSESNINISVASPANEITTAMDVANAKDAARQRNFQQILEKHEQTKTNITVAMADHQTKVTNENKMRAADALASTKAAEAHAKTNADAGQNVSIRVAEMAAIYSNTMQALGQERLARVKQEEAPFIAHLIDQSIQTGKEEGRAEDRTATAEIIAAKTAEVTVAAAMKTSASQDAAAGARGASNAIYWQTAAEEQARALAREKGFAEDRKQTNLLPAMKTSVSQDAAAAARGAANAFQTQAAAQAAAAKAAANKAAIPGAMKTSVSQDAAAAARGAANAAAAKLQEQKLAAEKVKAIEAEAARNRLKALTNVNSPSILAAENAIRDFKLKYGNMGGMVPKYMASGGFAKGTDTVPAMLTPGEFIVNRKATQTFGPLLSAINSPTFSTPKSMSSSVMGSSGSQTAVNNSKTLYNYNLSVNVSNSNANPNDIARTVINQIKMIENQRIRSS